MNGPTFNPYSTVHPFPVFNEGAEASINTESISEAIPVAAESTHAAASVMTRGEAAPAQATPNAEIPAEPIDLERLYTVTQFKEMCEKTGKVATEVHKLEEATPLIMKQLEKVGQELKNLGAEPIEFKGEHLEKLHISGKMSLENAAKILENETELKKKDLKRAFGAVYESEEAKKKAVFANDNLEAILKGQQEKAHFQPINFTKVVQSDRVVVDVKFPSAAVAAIFTAFFTGSVYQGIGAFVLAKMVGLK